MADDTQDLTAPNPDASSSLSWMPVYVSDLMALASEISPASLGGLMRLRAYAWGQVKRGCPPCTLPESDSRLATISGLGAEWAEHGPAIRERLVAGDMENTGWLVEPWLLEVYQVQLAKYISASTRGRKGGRPPTNPDGKQNGKQPEKLGLSPAFSQLRSALSSELSSTARENTDETKAGEKLSFPERSGEAELERREREWLAANPGKALPLSFHAEQARADDKYDAWLTDSVEQFRRAFPELYAQHVANARSFQGWNGPRSLNARQRSVLRDDVVRRVQLAENWPTREQWVEWQNADPADKHRFTFERDSAVGAWGVAHPRELGDLEVEFSNTGKASDGTAGKQVKDAWLTDRITRLIPFPTFGDWRRRRRDLAAADRAAGAGVA